MTQLDESLPKKSKPYQKKLPTKTTAKKSTKIAIKLANRGFKLIPCSLKNKVPCINWKTHPGFGFDEINQYLEINPDTFWAIRCDKFGAYDFDCYSPTYGTDAKKLFSYFEKNCKIKQKTLNGGWHFLVRDKLDNTPATDGVDRRGKDGIIFLYDDFLPDKIWSQIHDIDDFLSLIPYLKNILPTHLLTNTQKKGNKLANGAWKEGQRNNNLNKEAYLGRTTGENERIVKAITKAAKSGLSDDEIIKVVASQHRGFLIQDSPVDIDTKPKKTAEVQKKTPGSETFKVYEFKRTDNLVKPPTFVDRLLLHNTLNYVTGPQKIGKTTALFDLGSEGLEKIPGATGLIISIENPVFEKLQRQIHVRELWDTLRVVDKKIARFEPSEKPNYYQRIDWFIQRIENHLRDTDQWLNLDPIPRFNLNNEETSVYFAEALMDLGARKGLCITGVRNDGKEKSYDEGHKVKGSSGFTDQVRLHLRGLKIDKTSHIGKEIKGTKNLILTSQFGNNLMKDCARVYSIIERTFKHKGINETEMIAIKQKDIKQNLEKLKFLISAKSGQSTQAQVYLLIMKEGAMERKRIIEVLDHLKEKDIYTAITRLINKGDLKEAGSLIVPNIYKK